MSTNTGTEVKSLLELLDMHDEAKREQAEIDARRDARRRRERLRPLALIRRFPKEQDQ